MKKVFYIKGMATDVEEFSIIKEKFLSKGIELILVIPDYSVYTGMKKMSVIDDICTIINQELDKDETLYIISHSMGCNFIPSVLKNIENTTNIVMISPEFESISKEEQASVVLSSAPMMNPPKVMPMGIKKLKNIVLYISSKKWFAKDKDIFRNSKLTVLASTGDKYVSKRAIEELCDNYGGQYYYIDCNNHNPLLEGYDAIDIICNSFDFGNSLTK